MHASVVSCQCYTVEIAVFLGFWGFLDLVFPGKFLNSLKPIWSASMLSTLHCRLLGSELIICRKRKKNQVTIIRIIIRNFSLEMILELPKLGYANYIQIKPKYTVANAANFKIGLYCVGQKH